MVERIHISALQLGYLIFSFLSGFSTLYLLQLKIIDADAWMSILFGTCGGIVLAAMLIYIQTQYPGRQIFDYSEQIVGKWLAKLFTLWLVYYTAQLCILSSKALTAFYSTAIMPRTPSYVFSVSIFIVSTYAVYLGIEAIARAVQVVLPVTVISLLILNLLIFKIVDTNPFLPAFQSKFNEIVYATLFSFAFPFSKIIVFAALFGYVKHQKKLIRSSILALLLSGVYLFAATYLTLGSVGAYLSSIKTYPYFTSLSMIRIGDDIERFEISAIGFWTMFVIFEVIIAQYVVVKGLRYLFALKQSKWLNVPIALLLFAISEKSFSQSSTDIVDFEYTILPFAAVIPTIVIPIVLFLVTLVKKGLHAKSTKTGN
ncbi:GerAB/ArcD/ProY family transporter [Paenibacillus sp. 481]|uniref:GerAB/ArcD/ProY family transporter n=1 Tax=Paenibacillus sp. 481 TaxID=2835869 RepID=UPI001E525165|nr:endospore germination permease [Paenibacillus sp. 481]UHA73703.1 endospore germination permease [Paenibacillus sp. 481]